MTPQAPPALAQPAPAAPLRAQYGWGYSGPDGEGIGTLSLLLEVATGRLVVELHAQGERVMVLEGDRAAGYRLQVPRQQVDERATSLAALPVPFLPQVATVEALSRLLRTGEGAGVTVLKRDAQGPLRLHWKGKDPKGKDEQVWLDRKRWEPGS
jgi:hypothetical protein